MLFAKKDGAPNAKFINLHSFIADASLPEAVAQITSDFAFSCQISFAFN